MRLHPDRNDLPPGTVLLAGQSVLVGTGSHAVELTQVKPAGKGWMDAAAWLRGIRDDVEFTDAH